jgi:protein PhnA
MGRDYWENQNNEDEESISKTVDCNGAPLNDGDSVTLIKDLKVKGAGTTLKRGTMIKSIRTNENNLEEIDCSTKQVKGLVLKTCFVKKV